MARIHRRSSSSEYKKDLHDPDNHDGVITHLEPEILECEVKWALESITTNKASGGDGIPVELFQILNKNPPASVGVVSSILESGRSPEEGDGNSSILAWETPWTE